MANLVCVEKSLITEAISFLSVLERDFMEEAAYEVSDYGREACRNRSKSVAVVIEAMKKAINEGEST
jgi:hypothetical protein